MAKSKKNTIPLYWVLLGLILLFYNNVIAFLASFGFSQIWQANLVLLGLVIVAAYYFTPYLDAVVRGK